MVPLREFVNPMIAVFLLFSTMVTSLSSSLIHYFIQCLDFLWIGFVIFANLSPTVLDNYCCVIAYFLWDSKSQNLSIKDEHEFEILLQLENFEKSKKNNYHICSLIQKNGYTFAIVYSRIYNLYMAQWTEKFGFWIFLRSKFHCSYFHSKKETV